MQRRQDIEFFRIISTFAVVWFHSGLIDSEIAYGGLIIFLLLSTYIAGTGKSYGTTIFPRRVKRLLLPWLVWFVIYGAVNVIVGKPVVPLNNGIIAGILTGPSVHLWYLPFLFSCLFVFDLAKKRIPSLLLASISAALTILIVSSAPLWRSKSFELGYPLAQYMHASAGIFLGIFFSKFHELPYKILFLLFIFAASILTIPLSGIGIPYLIGVTAGCTLVFLDGKNLFNFQFEPLSQYMFGVYLIHPLLIRLLNQLPSTKGYWIPIIAFFSSTYIIYLLKKYFTNFTKFYI